MSASENANSGFPHHLMPTSPQVPLVICPWLSEKLQPTICKTAAWPLSLWGFINTMEAYELSSRPASPAVTPTSRGAPLNVLVTSLPSHQGIVNDLNGWRVPAVPLWNTVSWRVFQPYNMHSSKLTSLSLFLLPSARTTRAFPLCSELAITLQAPKNSPSSRFAHLLGLGLTFR